ncbi:MAG: hypothetical protein AAFY53_07325 [Pseudomonadota bacterium]
MFGLSPAMAGGVAGLLFGIVNFIALRYAADHVEGGKRSYGRSSYGRPDDGRPGNSRRGDGGGVARILRVVALVDLGVFPVLGYALGPLIFAS